MRTLEKAKRHANDCQSCVIVAVVKGVDTRCNVGGGAEKQKR